MILLKRQLIPNEAPPKLILETIMSVFPRGRYSIVFATSLWKPGSNSIFWKRKCNNKGTLGIYHIISLLNSILPICSRFFFNWWLKLLWGVFLFVDKSPRQKPVLITRLILGFVLLVSKTLNTQTSLLWHQNRKKNLKSIFTISIIL